jgi:hypothetical protein
MAPDWEKLAEEWEGHEIGFVAEVDCTAEGTLLCDEYGVQGFPSIKYGDPTNLEDYEGARSYEDLAAFAKKNLKLLCSASNIDLCDDETKKKIEELNKLSIEEIEKIIEAETEKVTTIETEFENAVNKLEETWNELDQASNDKIAAIKESSDLGLLKSIKSAKAKAEQSKESKDEL